MCVCVCVCERERETETETERQRETETDRQTDRQTEDQSLVSPLFVQPSRNTLSGRYVLGAPSPWFLRPLCPLRLFLRHGVTSDGGRDVNPSPIGWRNRRNERRSGKRSTHGERLGIYRLVYEARAHTLGVAL